jgi:hypothetical protein
MLFCCHSIIRCCCCIARSAIKVTFPFFELLLLRFPGKVVPFLTSATLSVYFELLLDCCEELAVRDKGSAAARSAMVAGHTTVCGERLSW